jgi:hypothetical protein
MKIRRVIVGLSLWVALVAIIVGVLAFTHANSLVAGEKCFATFKSAQWPNWIGCAMAAHENLAGGLVGFGGALFAAWLAFSGTQDQIRETNAANRRTEKLKAKDEAQRLASDIDVLMTAKGYLSKFSSYFPDDQKEFETFDFVKHLNVLRSKARVFVSQTASAAPYGFGTRITTVMWRLKEMADEIYRETHANRAMYVRPLNDEVKEAVAGVRTIIEQIDAKIPSLQERLLLLKDIETSIG